MYVSNTSLSSIVISWHYWKKRKKKKKMVSRYGIPVLSIFNVTVDHSFSYNNIYCKSWEKQRYRKQIKFFTAKKKIMIRKDIYLFQIKQGCFLLVSSNPHHGWWPLYMWVWGGWCVQTGPCSTLWCHTVEGRGPGYLHHTGFWVLWGI